MLPWKNGAQSLERMGEWQKKGTFPKAVGLFQNLYMFAAWVLFVGYDHRNLKAETMRREDFL